MKVIAKLVAVFGILVGCAAQPASAFSPEDTIILGREMTRATMQPVITRVLELTVAKKVLPNLNVIINSGGGSVLAGFQYLALVKALRTRGTTVTCYVVGVAASMAFHVLTQCDKRIVLNDSLLLWHRARVTLGDTPLTGVLAKQIAIDLDATDSKIFREVEAMLIGDMTHQEIGYHFEVETLHYGDNLCKAAPHFCTAVDTVPGIFEAVISNKIPRAEAPFNPFGKIPEVLYIWSVMLGGAP